jgi:DNA-binding phage protein
MKKKNLSHEEVLSKFAHSPEFRIEFVNSIMSDNLSIDQKLKACIQLIEATILSEKLSKAALAKKMKITRDGIYKLLKHQNPTLETFIKIIELLGISIQFSVKERSRAA